MEHIVRGKTDRLVLSCGFVPRPLILVIQPYSLVTSDRHPVRHQRIQSDDLVAAVAEHLGEGVAPQQQVRHEGFSENEARHRGVRFIMQQPV